MHIASDNASDDHKPVNKFNKSIVISQNNVVKKHNSSNHVEKQQDGSRFNVGISLISVNQSDILDAHSEQFDQLEQFLSKDATKKGYDQNS